MSDPQVESIPSQQENDKSDKFQIVSFEQVKNKCEVCQKKTTTGCSACRAVYYCSYEHQKQHWPQHKSTCQGKTLHRDATLQTKPTPQLTTDKKIQNQDNFKTPKKQSQPLAVDQQKQRKLVVIAIANNDFQEAIIPAKKCVEISRKIYQLGQKQEFYEMMADQLLLAKVFINLDDMKSARELLMESRGQLDSFLQEGTLKNMRKDNAGNDSQEIKKVTSILSTMASFFYATGDFINCQNQYVEYVKLIENVNGPDVNIQLNIFCKSYPTANAYFTTGVFYLQHKRYLQSLACFKRAINIRIAKQSSSEQIADCWYNIGIIYKQTGKHMKAIETIEKSLQMRRELIGELSLQVAMCLETLGKIFMQENDYKSALNKLSECFQIRRRLINNDQHPDLVRISLLIVYLYEQVKEKLMGNFGGAKVAIFILIYEMQQILQNIQHNVQNTISTNALGKYLGNDPEKVLIEANQRKDIDSISVSPSYQFEFEMDFKQLPKKTQTTNSQLLSVSPLNLRTRAQTEVSQQVPFKTKQTSHEDLPLSTIRQQEIEEDEHILVVQKPLLSNLSIDQVILLEKLQKDLKERQRIEPKFNPRKIVVRSEFLETLSNMQFALLRDYNPYLFINEENELQKIENQRKEQAALALQERGVQYNINIITDEKKYLTDEENGMMPIKDEYEDSEQASSDHQEKRKFKLPRRVESDEQSQQYIQN